MEFRYRVVPFGTRFESRSGERPVEIPGEARLLFENEVAVDVGGACWHSSGADRGVLDHHFVPKETGRQPFPAASAAVLHQAGVIVAAYRDRFATVWLVAHEQPDFDAACAMYLARCVIEGKVPADGWSEFRLKPDPWEPGPKVINWFQPWLPDDPGRRWPILLAANSPGLEGVRAVVGRARPRRRQDAPTEIMPSRGSRFVVRRVLGSARALVAPLLVDLISD
jgi:hypothetical protein